MNRKKNIFLLLIISLGSASGKESMNLWPATAPGEVAGEVGEEEKRIPKDGSNDVLRIANVCDPILTIFPVDEEKSNRTAVIVCPGGGYNILAYEHEGTQVCEWLNQLGVTAVLLKYRVPRRKNRAPHDAPLQDAQRALGIVRKNAADWSIDPNKIGILGFSAGGNLAMMALTSFSERTYDPIDEADAISCRPDFGILIYPAYLVNRSKRDKLFPEITINDQTPPCFFAHTGDDHVPAEGSLLAYYELEKAGVEGSELHIYPYGGHGYGMKKTNKPVSQWPKRAGEWMKAMGWLELK
jgi:acetyl esterase/lipase